MSRVLERGPHAKVIEPPELVDMIVDDLDGARALSSAQGVGVSLRFLVAKNPERESSLPYLVQLPIDGGLILKVRAPWPATARVYCCHAFESAWPMLRSSSRTSAW